jgi:calcineurin-like phosphoesterase family protein
MIYFLGCPHYHHERVMTFCPQSRPYKNADEMNVHLIKSWNSVVKENDTGYILGDFSFSHKKEEVEYVFNSLNGKKILIKGNHDKQITLHLPWQEQHDYLVLKHNHQKYVLFHYPISDWDGKYHGSVHIYSHVHGKPQFTTPVRALDVGVDSIGPVPISIDEITRRMEKIEFKDKKK